MEAAGREPGESGVPVKDMVRLKAERLMRNAERRMLNVERSMLDFHCKTLQTVQDSDGMGRNFELKNSVGNHKEISLKSLLQKGLVNV